MPYKDISDLPKSQVDQYDKRQKKVFLEAYNHAFAVAHAAAKKADDSK
jgi:cation transport regulator ChaB